MCFCSGTFNDTKYMVTMLARSQDKLERDRLLLFLNKVTPVVLSVPKYCIVLYGWQ